MKQFWSPLILRDITEETILNAVKWFDTIDAYGGSLGRCTFLIFELLATVCSFYTYYGVYILTVRQRDVIGSSSDCALPRPPGSKHILLLGTGCDASADKQEEHKARQLAIDAPTEVLGEGAEVNILPNGGEDFHDRRKVGVSLSLSCKQSN